MFSNAASNLIMNYMFLLGISFWLYTAAQYA